VTYTRWGKSSCPNDTGAELVYSGSASGTSWNIQGGSAEKICMPKDPEYLTETAGVTIPYYSTVQGSEYELWGGPKENVTNYKVPCAVCYVPMRSTSIMVPAKWTCPLSWTREYYGYLTTEHHTHHRSSYTCIDYFPEIIPGTLRPIHSPGLTLIYYTVTDCLGFQCPPYQNSRILSCAVCTK
jgi:N-acetylated-alpha-linked acidic dipeptidase